MCYNDSGEEILYFWDTLIDPFRVPKQDYTVGIIKDTIYYGATPIYVIRGIQPRFRVIFAGQFVDGIGEMVGFPSVSVFNVMNTYTNDIARLSILQAIMSMFEMLGGAL